MLLLVVEKKELLKCEVQNTVAYCELMQKFYITFLNLKLCLIFLTSSIHKQTNKNKKIKAPNFPD